MGHKWKVYYNLKYTLESKKLKTPAQIILSFKMLYLYQWKKIFKDKNDHNN